MNVRAIEIIGGGLAGLSLGGALVRAGVPTTIFEAGGYPRHRVCGEFIAGLDAATIDGLGLAPILQRAKKHRTVEWFFRSRRCCRHSLAKAALGVSRAELDEKLAAEFVRAGGALKLFSRRNPGETAEGRVFANGRQPCRSEWVGMKMHVRCLELRADLEVHLGDASYVGLCEVGGGAINVCGLFHRRNVEGGGTGPEVFLRTLRRCGLGTLADRVQGAESELASFTTIAGLGFKRMRPERGVLRIGDSADAIPPFSGHGMALAFKSAECAVAPLLQWSQGRLPWTQAVAIAQKTNLGQSGRSLLVARFLHPWLLSSGRQLILSVAQRAGVAPLPLITRLLHA